MSETPNVSRLRKGKLTFGSAEAGNEFSCQTKEVVITTAYNSSGDKTELLCGAFLMPATTADRTMKTISVADFEFKTGLMRYFRDNELKQVPFTWQASPTSEICSGVVEIRLGDWGGKVGENLDFECELPLVSDWKWSDPPGVPVITVAKDPDDSEGKTAKVTITSGGPVKVTFGESGHTDDDGELADGASKSHAYTTNGTHTITAESKADANKKASEQVTIPFQ